MFLDLKEDRKIGIIFPEQLPLSFGSAVQSSLHFGQKNYLPFNAAFISSIIAVKLSSLLAKKLLTVCAELLLTLTP